MTVSVFNVVFAGAGGINFGSPEGPWNHSERLEKLLGERLKVLAIIDPMICVAQKRINDKLSTGNKDVLNAYAQTQCFATIEDAKESEIGTRNTIHLIVNGIPPHFRGTELKGKDADVQLMDAFPNAKAILTEKPVSASDPTVIDCDSVAEHYKNFKGATSVGYVLRYLNVVQTLKKIMKQHQIVPMCINARYIMAYEYTTKLHWWNKDISCGPIVEQATHFVDLIRYLSGSPIDHFSVQARTVEHDCPAGKLNKMGFDENALIPAEQRIPRITTASWRHQHGTLSTLMHGVALHGPDYSTEIDIVADGWLLRLSDLYQDNPKLAILKQGAREYEIICGHDDPFLTEIQAIVSAVDSKDAGEKILSSYEDALATYKMTWEIRKAGEAEQGK
ncbi:uncharacterized protein FA14DRAFT_160024 [Meira miltonrushii]|uniref:Oxidoreductase putative C-terminal domain-containing protein n=1 Tax=Meira miltonrushii TaxID=1280837 RepID=A0A316VLG4_9BASI|nr:uncharacterized protein FA14DRAFT_160024 [Meira miltonrushii]PWN38469.1 hypothetical protein FA14DRAFT_160024 [Meira miltonrushii]